jgi:PAS domain S-box-containing protein
LQFTLDSIGDGLLTVDVQQRITSINRAAQQLTGWSRDEALGKPLDQVFHLINFETRQAIANPVRIVLALGRTVGLPADTILVAKDGTEYFVSSSIAPIRSHTGQVEGAVLVFRDITRLRYAERALKEAQQFTASLIENSLDMIIAVDRQRRIIEFNPAAERTFGYTRAEVLGQDISMLYATPQESERVRQLVRAEGSVVVEAQNRRKNGEIFPVLLSISPLKNTAGQVIGTMGVSRDITALRRVEEQRVRNERLAALGQMAAALAHEINNPLQAIRSALDLILDFPLPEHEREENLGIIRQEIERLSQVTERILRFARPAPGTRRMVSLSDLVRQTLRLADKYLQHRRIHVACELQDTPPLWLSPEQMIQVFLNLILNAIDATGEGGQLEITTHVENEWAVISFSNDGPILSPEEMEHIFEPFFTTKTNGTGLGLHLVQTIVQQHDGSIIAENIGTQRGVRFTIRLPLVVNHGESL